MRRYIKNASAPLRLNRGRMINNSFFGVYKDKKVLVTGHTGFKGSWLVSWLSSLGAHVYGISLPPSTIPSNYVASQIGELLVDDIILDISQTDFLRKKVVEIEPDFIFHLAAQALVGVAYEDPVLTYSANTMGTLNMLNAVRNLKKPCICLMVTSDKVYENLEWTWGYRETDRLGGADPYSASKAAAELIISSYTRSFLSSEKSLIRVGIARAGNVIGGGDWSSGRIVPDCIRSWSSGQGVKLRNPSSTRPWQHVLEPLSGYLLQAATLFSSDKLHGEAFNFGPISESNYSVGDLVARMSTFWSGASWSVDDMPPKNSEAMLLKLNCDKASSYLHWAPTLNFEETLKFTMDWYLGYYKNPSFAQELTKEQLSKFSSIARNKGFLWAN